MNQILIHIQFLQIKLLGKGTQKQIYFNNICEDQIYVFLQVERHGKRNQTLK